MQRPQGTFRSDGIISILCRKARAVFINTYECIELWIQSLDLSQMSLEQFGCGDNPIANASRHLPCGKPWEWKHGGMLTEPHCGVHARRPGQTVKKFLRISH